MRYYKPLLLAMVAILSAAVLLPVQVGHTQSEIDEDTTPEPSSLLDIFTGSGCSTVCWRGLAVGVTTPEDAKRILFNQNIDYRIGMLAKPDDSWVWKIDNASPFIDQDQQITVMTEFYQEILWRVFLLDTHICAAQIIQAFGKPDATVIIPVLSGSAVDMYYFDEGLAFFGTRDKFPYFDLVFLAQEEFLRRFMGDVQPVNWETVNSQYAMSCFNS